MWLKMGMYSLPILEASVPGGIRPLKASAGLHLLHQLRGRILASSSFWWLLAILGVP